MSATGAPGAAGTPDTPNAPETLNAPDGGAIATVDQRSVPAAMLVALAESGLIFLPLGFVAEQSAVGARGGPLDSYPVFAVLFAAGAALATAGRRSRAFGPVVAGLAVAIGVVQARAWGAGGAGGTSLAIVLSLAAAVRLATLALRDWRDPVHVSFGVLTCVLLLEVVLAPGAGWTSQLEAVIPIFFVASLASRAASLRIGDAVGLGDGGSGMGRQWGRLVVAMAGAALGLVALAALLGDQARVLERFGRFIPLAVYGGIYAGTFVVSLVLKPVGWVLSQLGFHAGAIQQLIRRLPRFRTRTGRAIAQHGPTSVSLRAIGLVVITGIALLLAWLIVRQRRRWMLRERSLPEVPAETIRPAVPHPPPGRRRRRPRGELPDDAVRRLYAETLLALEDWGAARPAHLTPGEYLREVAADIPASAPSFTALTRAYEDVRYGSRSFDRAAVDVMEVHRDAVLDAVRRAPRRERAGPSSGER
jgi:hypothetical protein